MGNKDKFITALRGTRREGVDRVIAGLEELGFFTAPASTKFHLCEPGGLLVHSLNVYVEALALRELQIRIRPCLEASLPVESVTIAALLHDVCKAESYRQVEMFPKEKNDKWEKYKTYDVDYSGLPLGHGEKSVVRLLQWGLALTEDEMLAIRWHMGAWDLSDSTEARKSFNAASDRSPLLSLLVSADVLATRLLEA